MTAREIAEAELMKMRPRSREKVIRLVYALVGPTKGDEVVARVGELARTKGLP